jgi:uncharacterized protein with PIN domain
MGSALDTQVVVHRCVDCTRELAWVPASQLETEVSKRFIASAAVALPRCAECMQKARS